MRHLVMLIVGIMGLCAVSQSAVLADDLSSLTAEQIIDKMMKQSAFGWDDAEAVWRMTLADGGGGRSERVVESLQRREKGKVQSIWRFRAPADVAGTAFLLLERDNGESEQYIYLPGLKRTRRIVGREREGSFMGSDFSYADFDRRDMRDATAKRLPDEDIGGVKTFVLESTPKKDANSTYAKIETWLRQDNYLPLRMKYYDKSGKLLKTFYAKRIRTIEGKPVIVELQMVNKQNGHSTDIVVDHLQSKKDLPDAAFTPTALEHG